MSKDKFVRRLIALRKREAQNCVRFSLKKLSTGNYYKLKFWDGANLQSEEIAGWTSGVHRFLAQQEEHSAEIWLPFFSFLHW